MEYAPLVTESGVPALMPVMVTGDDVITVSMATFVWSMKVKVSGVMSAGNVVTANTPEVDPMVRVVVVVVAGVMALVCRTQTVPPGEIVPGAWVNVAVQPTEYSPLATEMFPGMLVPVTVIVSDVMTVANGTFISAVNVNGSGLGSRLPETTRLAVVMVPQEIRVNDAS